MVNYKKKYLKYKKKYLTIGGSKKLEKILVPKLDTWNLTEFILNLTIEELKEITDKTFLYILEITKGKIDETDKLTVWTNRLNWVELLMSEKLYLTETELNKYKSHVICYIREFPLTFEFIWGKLDDPYRLIELLQCCKIIFSKLEENKTKFYDEIKKYKCKYLNELAKKINKTNEKDLTEFEKSFIEIKINLKNSFISNIKSCISKYLKLLNLYCEKHTDINYN